MSVYTSPASPRFAGKTLWRGAYKYRGVSSHGTHQPLGFARSDRWSTYDGPTDQADERADRLTRAVGE